LKAIALLSGGLDSAVSMLKARQTADIVLALTFDYGQKARENEIEAARAICSKYGIEHRLVTLPFMQAMKSGIIENSGVDETQPWVPNRNGLFINVAACYAEDMGADWIVCGFNHEEGVEFPDNTQEFVNAVNEALKYSTLTGVKLVSLVQDMDKPEIVETALSLGIDLDDVWSCYRPGIKPCGQCPSCLRNKEAYMKAGIRYD